MVLFVHMWVAYGGREKMESLWAKLNGFGSGLTVDET